MVKTNIHVDYFRQEIGKAGLSILINYLRYKRTPKNYTDELEGFWCKISPLTSF